MPFGPGARDQIGVIRQADRLATGKVVEDDPAASAGARTIHVVAVDPGREERDASVALALGDFAALRRDAIEALEVCDRNDDRWGRVGHLANLGFAAFFAGGSLAEARSRFEAARPLYRELGNLGILVVTVLAPLSSIALRQGDLAAAEGYATEAVELPSGTGWEASALVIYGEGLAARGELDPAMLDSRRSQGPRPASPWEPGAVPRGRRGLAGWRTTQRRCTMGPSRADGTRASPRRRVG